MVLFYHALIYGKEDTELSYYGNQGVDGFFIMSGWLNAISVTKSINDKGYLKGI